MKILAIETSCDETAVALLEVTGPADKPEIKILGNSLLSQIHLHKEYGGVYPHLAKREHEKNLPILLEQTLKEAGESLESPHIDFIAVTEGPGLEPALWTGITFAQELSQKWGKPIVPVNHMEGHVYSVLYQDEFSKLGLPAIALLVSGGHTELVLVEDIGKYRLLGQTRDDAVGEAFDKVARMLGLPYPGGPEISRLALEARTKKLEPNFKFPRPMIHSKDFNFSFSGLKTAVLYKLKELAIASGEVPPKAVREIDESTKAEVARAFEDAAIDVLVKKTEAALIEFDPKTLIVAGGVAANKHLQSELAELINNFPNTALLKPEPLLTTDNAIMIGLAAFVHVSKKPESLEDERELVARGNLEINSWL